MRHATWKNFKEWKRHGIEREYNQRNPASLNKSENKEERSWYNKGGSEGWLRRFNFNRIKGNWSNVKEWKKYGIERGYENRNPSSLLESEDREERKWCNRGHTKKWMREFNFNRKKVDGRWNTLKEWKKDGIEREYNQRNSASLENSKDKEERSWYNKGISEKWIMKFNFMRRDDKWENVWEWIKDGIDKGYERRNPFSLYKSKDKEERSWYLRGNRKNWLGEFNFKRIARFMSNKQFERLIRKDENALRMAYAAANANGFSYDIEKIIMGAYEGKFKNQKELHELLRNNADKIKALVENGVTNLGAYIGRFSLGERNIFPIVEMAVDAIPMDKMTGPLEKRVASMLRIGYSPKFNDNPAETIKELEGKVYSSNEKMRSIYEGLVGYYKEVVSVMEELR